MIRERHRHRYEFNNAYREAFENTGMVLAGKSPDDRLAEIAEVPDHPWFVAVHSAPNSNPESVVRIPSLTDSRKQ